MRIHSVLIIDDHPTFRFGLRALLSTEPDLQVVGDVATAQEARGALEAHLPDAATIDISLGEQSGLELVQELSPRLAVLVVSFHEETVYAERALVAGARGYVMKDAPVGEIVDAVRGCLRGQLVFSPQATEHLLRRRGGELGDRLDQLSDRQLHIYELLGRGRSTREIAESLHLSAKTVENHIANIKRRLRVGSIERLRCEAARRFC